MNGNCSFPLDFQMLNLIGLGLCTSQHQTGDCYTVLISIHVLNESVAKPGFIQYHMVQLSF